MFSDAVMFRRGKTPRYLSWKLQPQIFPKWFTLYVLSHESLDFDPTFAIRGILLLKSL
jgi:hypothetical protein